ncbi:uncharacterized protein LOC143912556 [Arctopsyche grandis]|uniref:uncharacterized protein LOC143912556 n=1 Tax=Arctopsyche grandis TaxID=121162 RepID=UPI00406D6A9F
MRLIRHMLFMTNLKTASFTNPTIPDSGVECSYIVEINNLNVCQMRIDFEVFSLSLPTTTIDATTTTGPGYECHDDAFEITGDLPGDNVPILCGENVNQHVYVRVNASQNVRGFQMQFRIVGRGNRPTLQQPSWRLKVTQLECYNMPRKFKEIAILNTVPDFKLTADRDEYLIAPPGCLQYYPDRSGSIESFNYNRGTGPYLGNLLYAMCFRRQQNICGIRFTASTFQIESETNGENDGDCQVISSGTGTGDYLLLPEAQSSEGTRASKWCGSSMTTQIVAVMPPGPLYIHFRSDDLVKDAARELGFRLNYNLMSNCN